MALATVLSPLLAALASASALGHGVAGDFTAVLDQDKGVVAQLDSRFMSFTMDAGLSREWSRFDEAFFYNPRIINMAKQLGPAYFRFGGTSEDYTAYNFSGRYFPIPETARGVGILNETIFAGLVNFADSAGWDFVFGANAAIYRKAGQWIPDAFESLLSYVQSRKWKVYGYELGNEPDLYEKNNISVTSQQLGLDFVNFRSAVYKYDALAFVFGCDVADNADYLAQVLQGSGPAINGATFHFYYGPSGQLPHGLNYTQFADPGILDRFPTAVGKALNATGDWLRADSSRLFLVGETSSTYGGGTANASSSFIAGFMWLDKLAMAARLNVHAVARQTFAFAKYSVIGEDGEPNADYFTSALWSKLVKGAKMLAVQDDLTLNRVVRVYAFCGDSGGLTYVVLNCGNSTVDVQFADAAGSVIPGERQAFVLTSYPGVVNSRSAFLNREELKVTANGDLPSLPPVLLPASSPVSFPAKSYGFVVLPNPGSASKKCE